MKEKLINNFFRISSIPRASGNEEKIADFFVNVAKKHNLDYFRDENNNVLIKKKGNINGKPIALQSHLDMVCIKSEDSNHCFQKYGIDVIIDGDKVMANNTSLGADQGVGLAMMLSIIEDAELKHPDIEFIFTVEEETTFKGAVLFPYSKVISKQLINLDNSCDDSILVGATGDICNEYSFNANFIENTLPSYRILIDNFQGGNSGENIEISNKNAITTMAELLFNKDVFIRSINGGTSENDLATWCEVVINTSLNVDDMFKGLNYKVTKLENKLCFSRKDTDNIINQILQLKCGFISSNMASANLGVANTVNNEVKLYYVFRSVDEKELIEINKKTINLNNNFKVLEMYRDSIWGVNNNSELLRKYKELYFELYKEYPKEKIGHGGIECSAIKKRIDGLDIISIGSTIHNYHTIYEVTYVSSWLKIYNLLLKFLERL